MRSTAILGGSYGARPIDCGHRHCEDRSGGWSYGAHAPRDARRRSGSLNAAVCVTGRCLAFALLLACAAAPLSGSDRASAADPYRASISPAARKDAIDSMPLDQLDRESRNKVMAVLNSTGIFRRLPTQVLRCDPEMYLFLADRPEILANIWQLMQIEDVVLEPIGPGRYRASDGAGTRGMVEFLYRTHDTHLIYAEGAYDGPMFAQPVQGNCVLLLKSGYSHEPDGRYYITSRLDVFVHLDNVGLEFLAKTFHPLVGRVADYNFGVTSSFVQNLSYAAEVNPAGVERLAGRLTNIAPTTRAEFVQVSQTVAEKAAQRWAKYQYDAPGSEPPDVPRTARAQNR